MANLEINPRFRDILARHSLSAPEDFLALRGVVCSGHLDRHVARVTLKDGDSELHCFLKREHKTRWRDRLESAMAGFGWVSKSRREYTMLRNLEAAGVGAPQAIAAGEDNTGRAFLLVAEVPGAIDLRLSLIELATKSHSQQREFARQLGKALAQLHNAGFEHPDLCSKHVLVARGPRIYFLDLQRCCCHSRLTWSRRWRDLAILDATLANELASPRLRLAALRSYLKCVQLRQNSLASTARDIRRRSSRQQERSRFREMRLPPMQPGTQNLIWLEGESLQVTREFHEELGGRVPDWLCDATSKASETKTVSLGDKRLGEMTTRWASRPLAWLWSRLRRRPVVAPEVESMKTIFRLERFGVVAPRLLATGQKQIKPWQIQSFLLTEARNGAPLTSFLRHADARRRRSVIRQAARQLRHMHQATCYGENRNARPLGDLLCVRRDKHNKLTVALASIHGVDKSPYPNPRRARQDLANLALQLDPYCSRSDLLRGLLEYMDQDRFTKVGRLFAQRVLAQMTLAGRRRRVAA